MCISHNGAEGIANQYALKVKAGGDSTDTVSMSSEPECSRPTAHSSNGFTRNAWLSRGSTEH